MSYAFSDSPNAQKQAETLSDKFSDVFDSGVEYLESVWNWVLSEGPEQAVLLGVATGLFIGLRVIRAFVSGLLRSKKSPGNAPRNIAASIISGTWSIFLLILSVTIVAPFAQELPDAATNALSTTFMIVLVIQGALWMRILISGFSSGYLESHPRHEGGAGSTAITLIKTLSSVIVWAIAIAMILTNLGYEIGPIVAGLGVGGLAIGLALQNVFKDLFSSLSIIFDRPFVRGDYVKLGDGEFQGEVEKIGMKTTRIRSLTGEQIIVGNGKILDTELRNYRRMDERRSQFDIGVVYQTSHEELKSIPLLVEEAAKNVDDVLFERCRFKSFGDSALIFDVVIWVKDREYGVYLEKIEAVLLNIHEAFEREQLSFAYPTKTLHIEQSAA